MSFMYRLLGKIGTQIIETWRFIKGHSLFCLNVVSKGIFSKYSYSPAVRMSILRQIYFSGIELTVIITIAALLLGMTLVGLISKVLFFLDVNPNIGPILTVVIIRITGPAISGILIILRTSTTLLVDIGMMKFNKEITSIQAMNIDPDIYLYYPRIVASVVSMVVLAIYFSALSIIGGYLLLSFQLNTSLDYVLSQIFGTINFSDVATFVFKTILIGFTAASIPIYIAKSMQNSQTALIKGMQKAMLGIFFTFVIIIILGEILI